MGYWHPKYWPTWAGIAVTWLVTRLPFPLQLALGRGLGSLAFRVAPYRRHITEVNIELCFPELSSADQAAMVKRVFRSCGEGIIETANAWLGEPGRLAHRFTITGISHLESALASGAGVILLGMHFATLDLSGAVLAQRVAFDVMYRRNKNRLLDAAIKRGRERHFPRAINRTDTRAVLRSLKEGRAVWYGPDQDYGRKHSVFAPFFGVEAASITATSRFAQISGAKIILFQHYRTDARGAYEIALSPPLEDFPTDDPKADAALVNQLVESAVRKHPEQYWWLHRRFKTRPGGQPRPY